MVYFSEYCSDCFLGPVFTITQAGISCKWTSDSQRFLLEHFDTINDSPSHIYHSALPFSPPSSWLHECYSAELSQEVKVVKGLPAGWGRCSRTVTLGSRPMDLSYWNNTIAVGSGHGDIIILDSITGSQITALSEHTGEINSLVFSSDGKLLVSGSDDKTVKLWDVQTGGVVKTFCGHTLWVQSVSISVDCTRIASGSGDQTIRLWDIHTGECYCVIQQQGTTFHTGFSPKVPQHFLSTSSNKVQQWDINGHQAGPTYDGSHFTFSSDGAQLVLCNGTTVTVQDSSSGVAVAEFHVENGTSSYCCFSPDDRLVAVAAKTTAYVWDITSPEPHLIETFIGHTDDITSLAFSSPSSLISASVDQSVRFWQIGAPDLTVADLNPTPPTLAAIKSITLQAKDGITITSDSDGVVRTWDISTGICKASFHTPAEDIHRGDVQLISSRLIFVWYANEKINTWDVGKGELLWAVDGLDDLEDLGISGDGSRVFCLSSTSIQALSVQTGEVVSETKIEYSNYSGSLTVGGSRVWAHYPNSPDSEYQGWDFGILGSSPVQLPNMSMLYLSDTLVWDPDQSKVKDTVTGKAVFQLSRRFGKLVYLRWSHCYLAACFDSTELLILDFNHVPFW